MLKRLPLEGVTVIEMGHSVAAPYAGEILGDLGADVIKIEKADGDDARKWAPPYWGEMSSTFQSLNRNKRSAIVNLKDPAEREALRKLIIERADVVIQNLRPGSAEEFGLDAESLRVLKPDLIYCTIGAFGAKGPLKDRPGYDPLMQAFDGPTALVSCGRRDVTTVAPQGLALLNDRFVRLRAEDFARRLRKEAGEEINAQVRLAWQLAFGRDPQPNELEASASFIEAQAQRRSQTAELALADFCQMVFAMNEFVYVD